MFEQYALSVPYTSDDGAVTAIVRGSDELFSHLASLDTRNRDKSAMHSKLLTKAADTGKTVYNGVPIVVCRDGYVINGGHRISVWGKTAYRGEFLLIWNADPSLWSTYDNNNVRKLTCHISATARVKGVTAKKFLGSVLTYYLKMLTGRMAHSGSGLAGLGYTLDEQVQLFNDYEEQLSKSYMFVHSYIGRRLAPSVINVAPATMWAAFHAQYDCDDFFRCMVDESLPSTHPAKMLVSRVNLLTMGESPVSKISKETYTYAYELAEKAFAYYNDGVLAINRLETRG